MKDERGEVSKWNINGDFIVVGSRIHVGQCKPLRVFGWG